MIIRFTVLDINLLAPSVGFHLLFRQNQLAIGVSFVLFALAAVAALCMGLTTQRDAVRQNDTENIIASTVTTHMFKLAIINLIVAPVFYTIPGLYSYKMKMRKSDETTAGR